MANNELRVTLLGDASKLNATLKTASGRLKSFGKSTQAIGRSLQTRLALPLALAGGAAIKMAADFDKSMTKIKSLVGIAGDEVDRMGESAKVMAKEFGVSSAKAAEALFFITSAGLRGDEAMQTLEASLKASAVGLGEVATIADLATSAMNAYGSDVLGASQATDILTAAVREGKLEASELAGAMGAVLPVASNMGVSFNEVGAAFAAMSRTGTDARVGATQLTAILAGLLKPTQQAEDALNEMGLSSAGLKQQIKDEGLLETLNTLKTAFDNNADAAQVVFPNIRALKGVLDLLGSGVEVNRGIFERMNDTMGMTQTAFDATAQSAEFRLRKAMNSAKESFREVGAVLLTGLLPIFEDVSRILVNVFDAFFKLDSGTQKLILGFGALAVALPTIISLIGTISSVIGALISPVGLIAAALAGVAYIIYKNWGEVLPVVVGLYNQFVDLYNGSEALRKVIFFLRAAFKTVFIYARTQVFQLINGFKTMWKLIKEFSEKGFKGSFTDILADGFEDSLQITANAASDVGKAFTDGFSDAVGSQLEKKTVEQVQGALTNVVDQAIGSVSGLFGALTKGGDDTTTAPTGGGDTLQPSHGFIGAVNINDIISEETVTKAEERAAKIRGFLMSIGLTAEQSAGMLVTMGQAVEDGFIGLGQNVANSMSEAGSAFNAFLSTFLQGAATYLAALFAESTGLAVTAAGKTAAAAGPMAAFVLPALIAGAVAAVSSGFGNIPAFADGGIVSGTTLGIMGEYTGAKQNPEVIAPLNKLEAMIGGKQAQQVNVGGEFRIQGQDLVVALQRAERNRSRLK
jgi:TP901 family phage tail tape measure protein